MGRLVGRVSLLLVLLGCTALLHCSRRHGGRGYSLMRAIIASWLL
jgi:hypothetical protein